MKRRAWIALLLGLGLSAAGCGDGGNVAGESGSLAAASATASGISLVATSSRTPIPAGETVHVELLAAGQDLFSGAGASCLHDPYTPGLLERDVTADSRGTIALSVALSELSSAVDATCAMDASTRLGQLDHLRIRLSIAATPQACDSFCGAAAAPARADCVASCASGSRKFVSATSYEHAALVQLDLASLGGVAAIALRPAFDSLGVPIAQTGALPDLVVDGPALSSSWRVTTEEFSPTDCAVVEGCVGAGTRRLLRFDGSFINAGSGDFALGAPTNNPFFVYSDCHQHYHLKSIMLYQLLEPGTKTPVASASGQAVSRKQGFCIEDVNQAAGVQPAKYDCDNQGLSSGWEDLYDGSLDCQWIDVTGVPPGRYVLRVSVNPEGLYPEADRTNNDSEVQVSIPEPTSSL
ncbi:MAG: hypothetical protein HY075_01800 [Deltaproteobacteria bacterium]|nr:hypothetical protein [Deltaproteobacteria bacterium]